MRIHGVVGWVGMAALALGSLTCDDDETTSTTTTSTSSTSGTGGGGGVGGSGGSGGSGGGGGYANEETLAYDDDTCDMSNGPAGDTNPGGMIAVCFTPPAYPCALRSASFFVGHGGVPTTTFGVRVFAAEGEQGPPATAITIPETTSAASAPGTWVEVDLTGAEVTITSGDFCVAMEWLTPFGANPGNPDAQILCSDNTDPDHERTWIYWADTPGWHLIDDIGVQVATDGMIRATVAY